MYLGIRNTLAIWALVALLSLGGLIDNKVSVAESFSIVINDDGD